MKRFEYHEKEKVNTYTQSLKDSCYHDIDDDIVDEDFKCIIGLGIIIE